MIRNYLKTALRNFWRNRVFSFINMLGLSIGISASLVIFLIVHYQFGFDKFETGRDRIYRVVSDMHFPDQVFKLPGVPSPMADAIRKEISGIEILAGFHLFNGDATVSISDVANGGKPSIFKHQQKIIFADDNYSKLFNLQWLIGSPGVLTEPGKVALTESRARTYFGTLAPADIIGRTITYNDSLHFTVAGILKDRVEPSEFNFVEIISQPTIVANNLKGEYAWDSWSSINSSSQLLLKLNKNVSVNRFQDQIKQVKAKYLKDDNLTTTHLLQPLDRIHFDADYGSFDQAHANIQVLYGLLAIAGFLLLLACINFINLTTAQGSQRAKEIGIRKTLGSGRFNLISQFMAETFLLTLFATLVSILLIPFLLKAFSNYIPEAINVSMLAEPVVVIFILVLTLTVSFLSGFYPALFLTRFSPVVVLKSQSAAVASTTRRTLLRKSLTVVQFIIAQIFIIATMVVSKQIHYSLNKEMGFKKNGIIAVELPFDDPDTHKRFVLLQQLQHLTGIDKIALAGSPPANQGIAFRTMTSFISGKKKETTVEIKYADSAYFDVYNMKLLAGKYPAISDSLVEYAINENYAQFLGFKNPAEALGKFIEDGPRKIPITGVLADIHTHSLHSPIKPLAFYSVKDNYSVLHIALSENPGARTGWQKTIAQIEKNWKTFYPKSDFSYSFFDEDIAKFYENEKNTSVLLGWATGLAITISCLGLLGLAIFTTNQRTKEIGVRKVLGATVQQIVFLLSKDFVQLIAAAFLVAVPVAWWAMRKWLDDFAYRTTLDWWLFATGGVCMFVIALAILSARTISAANANPVTSLRSE